MAKQYSFEEMLDPEAHGLEMCSHCNGYGSSLKDPIGVDRCTKCGGSGLLPKENVPTRKVNRKE